MAKQSLKITDFNAGMVFDKSARDIEDNEFSYLCGFTGSTEGVLRLSGQFTYVGAYQAGGLANLPPGVGSDSEDVPQFTTSTRWLHLGGHTNHGFTLWPGPNQEDWFGGGHGLFAFGTDNKFKTVEHIDSSGNQSFTNNSVLAFTDSTNGNTYLYQQYGHLDNLINENNGGYGYYGWFTGLGEHAAGVYSHQWPDGIEKVPQGKLSLNSKWEPWPDYYAPDGNLRISNGNLNSVEKGPFEPPKIMSWERRREVFQDPMVPATWQNGERMSYDVWPYQRAHHTIGGVWQVSHSTVEPGPYRSNLKMANDWFRSRFSSNTSPSFHVTGSSSEDNPMLGPGWGADDTMSIFKVPGVHNQNWGISLSFSEFPGTYLANDGSGTGHWQPNDKVRYKFYCTYLYDDSLQESHPTEFVMYPTFTSATWDPWDIQTNINNSIPLAEDTIPGLRWGWAGTTLGWGYPDIGFQQLTGQGLTSGAFAQGVDSDLDERPEIFGLGMRNTNGYPSYNKLQINTKVFFMPYVNPGYPYGYKIGGASDHHDNIEELGSSDAVHTYDEADLRIRGGRIYWSSNEDGHNELYLMYDMDWEKGVRAYGMGASEGEGEWIPWKNKNTHGDGDEFGPPGNTAIEGFWAAHPNLNLRPSIRAIPDEYLFHKPPKIITYRDLNGYGHNESITARWKTSAKVHGRMYIGNYERPHKTHFETGSVYNRDSFITETTEVWELYGEEGNPQYNRSRGGTFYYPDDEGRGWRNERIHRRLFPNGLCKSSINRQTGAMQPDIFPENGDHEISISSSTIEGDEIVHLEGYSGKLLVFRVKSLMILDCSNDSESLEGEYIGMGLEGYASAACCKTDYGIAWINTKGVFLYDGSRVESLTAGKIDSYIRDRVENWPMSNDSTHSAKHMNARRWTFPEDKVKPITHSSYFTSNTGPTNDDPTVYGNVIKSIGYDSNSKKLICCKSIGDHLGDESKASSYKDILIYSFETESWSMTPDAHPSNMTNFVNFNGRLISWAKNFADKTYRSDENNDFASGYEYFADRFWTWTDEASMIPFTGPNYCHSAVKHVYRNPYSNSFDAAQFTASEYHENRYRAYTKDFTFGDPAVRKKIYKVYITYRCKYHHPNIRVLYNTNGDGAVGTAHQDMHYDDDGLLRTFTGTFKGGDVDGQTESSGLLLGPTYDKDDIAGTHTGGAGWTTVELKPTSSAAANNIYSFQLEFEQNNHMQTIPDFGASINTPLTSEGSGFVDSSFEINDITIVYRKKPLK